MLFYMMLSSIFMVNFLEILLFFVAILLFFLVIYIFKEISNILNSEIIALIFFNMWIPFGDGLLLFFLVIIEFCIFEEFFFVFFLLKFLLDNFLLLFSLHYVFFIFILFESCPGNSFSKTDDGIRYLDRDLAINILQINDAFLQMDLAACV